MRVVLLAVLFLSACSESEPPVAGAVGLEDELCELPALRGDVETTFLSYGSEPWQRAALVRPVGRRQGRTLLVFVHGGGWVGGNLHEHLPLAEHYARRGFVAASVTYKLATAGPTWPQPAYDVGCALKWAQDNASDWGADPARVTLIGTSAGGHLVSLVGAGSPDADCGQQPPLLAVTVSAPAALLALTPRDAVYPRAISLLGADPGDAATLWEAASADRHLTAQSAPFVVVHGARDRTVHTSVADVFVSAVEEAGGRVDYRILSGVRHGFEREPKHLSRLQCYLEPFLALPP